MVTHFTEIPRAKKRGRMPRCKICDRRALERAGYKFSLDGHRVLFVCRFCQMVLRHGEATANSGETTEFPTGGDL